MDTRKSIRHIHYTELGKLYGYPECCIKYFLKRCEKPDDELRKEPGRKLCGTGYVPCDLCNEHRSENELRSVIAKNRTYEKPFPRGIPITFGE